MHKPAALATLFSLLMLMLTLMGGCTSLGSRQVFSDDKGALRGYDPVSYFDEQQAVVAEVQLPRSTYLFPWIHFTLCYYVYIQVQQEVYPCLPP